MEHVSDTNIFARASADGRQFLVYGMTYQAAADLAMILPLPTPPGSAEDAVRFISLERYPGFFADLRKGFPERRRASRGDDDLLLKSALPLAVVEVGDFEASFVPTAADFARLDERFRLPGDVWDELPEYAGYGFAVFKLKKPKRGVRRVHPMAFEFPRADAGRLFFPTLHIHNGTVPAQAHFDHTLFYQAANPSAPAGEWSSKRLDEVFLSRSPTDELSDSTASSFMWPSWTKGIVDGETWVRRRVMRGTFENADVWV